MSKMKKSVVKFVSLFCVLCIVLCMSGCFGSSIDFSGISSSEDDSVEVSKYCRYYDQLDDFQKKLYTSLLGPISKAETEITLKNISSADFQRDIYTVIQAIQYDHPEYFWFMAGAAYSIPLGKFSDSIDVVVSPVYYSYVTAFFNEKSKQAELESAVKKVADLAREHSTNDHARIMFVHDYLIKNARYDHDGLNEYYATSHNPSCEYIFSAYGCLIDGKTVCSGYAKAFQLILTELGYDCTYVVGDAGGAHAWNCVFMENEGYFVDVTWDDHDYKKESPSYDYAFITSEELEITHKVETTYFDDVVCNATKYNYFVYNGYYDDAYDYETAKSILEAQVGNDALHIKYGSTEELGKAYKDLFLKSKLIPGVLSYSNINYNEDHCTLTFRK